MLLNEELATFLHQRTDPQAKFALGDWLQEVGDHSLLRLQSAKDMFRTPHDTASEDDVLAVAWMAMSAELGRTPQAKNVEDTFDWIDTMALAAMIEGYRRRGWLHIDRVLSIQPQATHPASPRPQVRVVVLREA